MQFTPRELRRLSSLRQAPSLSTLRRTLMRPALDHAASSPVSSSVWRRPDRIESAEIPSQRPGRTRFHAIDTARGLAMLLVFLSHFSRHYFRAVGAHSIHDALAWLTRISTPAFVLLSGMMLGLLRYEQRENFLSTRDKLVDRGLFLLLVCHPLIALAEIPAAIKAGFPWHAPFTMEVFVTDAIGVALIAGAFIAQRASVRERLGLGAVLLSVHWLSDVLWMPSGHSILLALREVISGRLHEPVLYYGFPLLPWFGVYLMGSGLGELFATWRDRNDVDRSSVVALRVGLGALGSVTLLKVLLLPLKSLHHDGATTLVDRVLLLGSVGEKLPPSMAYVGFYGGFALVILSVLLAAEAADRHRRPGPVRRWAALVGRNSLVAFVIQVYVYYVGVLLLPKPPLWVSPLYFAATVVLLLALLKICDTHRMNAYFCVGYARWARRQRGGESPTSTQVVPVELQRKKPSLLKLR